MKKFNKMLIMLGLCGVVTTLAFVAVNTLKSKTIKQSVVTSQNPTVYSPNFSEITNDSPKKSEINEKKPTNKPDVPKEVSKVLPAKSAIPTEPSLESEKGDISVCSPVSGGKILNNFSDSVLVFQETYGDYRTHLGIDILADKDAPVVAVAAGTVTKNYMDYEEGYTIEIEHQNGYTSVYKNLSTDKMAPVGKVVKQGDTISTVGDSGVFESHLPYHIHFEMKDDNVEIDPTTKIQLSN